MVRERSYREDLFYKKVKASKYRQLRILDDRHIKKSELAKMTDISYENIKAYFSEKSSATSLPVLFNIADALGISIDYILGRTEVPTILTSNDFDETVYKYFIAFKELLDNCNVKVSSSDIESNKITVTCDNKYLKNLAFYLKTKEEKSEADKSNYIKELSKGLVCFNKRFMHRSEFEEYYKKLFISTQYAIYVDNWDDVIDEAEKCDCNIECLFENQWNEKNHNEKVEWAKDYENGIYNKAIEEYNKILDEEYKAYLLHKRINKKINL